MICRHLQSTPGGCLDNKSNVDMEILSSVDTEILSNVKTSVESGVEMNSVESGVETSSVDTEIHLMIPLHRTLDDNCQAMVMMNGEMYGLGYMVEGYNDK